MSKMHIHFTVFPFLLKVKNREWNFAKARHHDDSDRVTFAAPTGDGWFPSATASCTAA